MSEDQSLGLVWAIGALVLVVSGFVARRVPMRTTVKMAVGWLLIFAAAFGIAMLWQGSR